MGYFSEEDISNQEREARDSSMAPATRSGKIINKYVNVRKSPSKTGEVLGQLPKDTEVVILGESGDYYQVKYKNYPKAYVASHLIEEIKNE